MKIYQGPKQYVETKPLLGMPPLIELGVVEPVSFDDILLAHGIALHLTAPQARRLAEQLRLFIQKER